jgi:hypothetical protein
VLGQALDEVRLGPSAVNERDDTRSLNPRLRRSLHTAHSTSISRADFMPNNSGRLRSQFFIGAPFKRSLRSSLARRARTRYRADYLRFADRPGELIDFFFL